MGISMVQAILLGLFACLASLPGMGGTTIGNYTLGRPLVGGLVVGLILGDIQTGIIVGAAIQLVYIALVTPGGGLSTAEVFRLWDGGFGPVALDNMKLAEAVTKRDLEAVDALCANALPAPALQLMPEIGAVMDRLRQLGARAVFMTGSGSTVVGAFDPADAAKAAAEIPGAILTHTLSRIR